MAGAPSSPSRREVRIGVAAALLLVLIIGGRHAYLGAQQNQSTFAGGTPTRMPSDKISALRLKFPKGSRSNWHTHSWGQLLMVEEGSGLTQERGGPVRQVRPGQPWFTRAGVEHWHGASPGEDMLQLTIYEGTVNWLGPVSDAEYLAAAQK
jgi:quercetin dioxygenase-like cupin family protein